LFVRLFPPSTHPPPPPPALSTTTTTTHGEKQQVRSMIGRFGVTGPAQTLAIKHLSDGLKSRVVFSWLAQKTPHMLLLDEREFLRFFFGGGGVSFFLSSLSLARRFLLFLPLFALLAQS
jgi:hypothetical protein